MWATIIIAESFTRIMASTAGNLYSTIVAVVYCSITLWILVGGQNFLRGGSPPPRWRRRCTCKLISLSLVSIAVLMADAR